MKLTRPTPRNIIIKKAKVKDREQIFKTTREGQLVIYKETLIKRTDDFSSETFQDRRHWQETVKVMKSKDQKKKR